jgi:hypothetical protein
MLKTILAVFDFDFDWGYSDSAAIIPKKFYNIDTCGLYYTHITIILDAASVVSKWRSKL